VTVVDLSYNQLRYVGTQYVYLKDRWENDWTLYPHVHCTSAAWAVAPTMPTATCVFDYGMVSQIGVKSFEPVTKLNCIGSFIKIVMETDKAAGQSNMWYGIVSHVEDEQMGIVGGQPTGRQTITSYGLEKLLDTEYISESWVDNGDHAPVVIQCPVTFNRGGRPNRSSTDKFTPAGSLAYLFYGQDGAQYDPAWWSTRDIVDYLLGWVPPKESFLTRSSRLPMTLDKRWLVLMHDRPEVKQEGQTIAAILSRLLDRRRLRSYYLRVEETEEKPHRIYLVPVAWNRSEIDLRLPDESETLRANDFPIDIVADYNQSTGIMLRESNVSRYDRIIVRGARRTSTATFVVNATSGLVPHWTSAEETAYEAAASGEAGYAGWDDLKQQQRNAEVRSSSKLSAAYSWFKIPDDWDYKALEYDSATATNYVFLDDDGLAFIDELIHEIIIEPFVPLWEHVDYSGGVILSDTAADPPAYVYRQPFVAFEVPTDARWVLGDSVGLLAESSFDPTDDGRNFRWSSSVYVQPDTRTIEIRVVGEQQHVIAKTDFTPLTEDRNLGDFDYRNRKMAVTATIRDNRYAEAIYPPMSEEKDDSSVDVKYGFIIYAGDDFRCDYVVPNTIVDIGTDGTPIVSSGGYVRDDRDILEALARVAYEWFSQTRVVLTLTTTQLTSEIQLGYFVEYLGDTDTGYYTLVNTMVSEIRISWPLLEGNQLEAPRMEIITGAGELDPMTLAPREPKSISKAKARLRR
jgi:hypothetical protein